MDTKSIGNAFFQTIFALDLVVLEPTMWANAAATTLFTLVSDLGMNT